MILAVLKSWYALLLVIFYCWSSHLLLFFYWDTVSSDRLKGSQIYLISALGITEHLNLYLEQLNTPQLLTSGLLAVSLLSYCLDR